MTIKTTELLRTSESWDGAALPAFPAGKPELRVLRLVFPAGAKTGWHHHPVINYGIVQQGELTIVCEDGTETTFHEGEALVEVVLLRIPRRRDNYPTSGNGSVISRIKFMLTETQHPYPDIERHPLQPFLPQNAQILMLGSFPPPKERWCMDFFYPNPQNDMWRIMGLVFFGDKEHFVEQRAKTAALKEQGAKTAALKE